MRIIWITRFAFSLKQVEKKKIISPQGKEKSIGIKALTEKDLKVRRWMTVSRYITVKIGKTAVSALFLFLVLSGFNALTPL